MCWLVRLSLAHRPARPGRLAIQISLYPCIRHPARNPPHLQETGPTERRRPSVPKVESAVSARVAPRADRASWRTRPKTMSSPLDRDRRAIARLYPWCRCQRMIDQPKLLDETQRPPPSPPTSPSPRPLEIATGGRLRALGDRDRGRLRDFTLGAAAREWSPIPKHSEAPG